MQLKSKVTVKIVKDVNDGACLSIYTEKMVSVFLDIFLGSTLASSIAKLAHRFRIVLG